MNKQLVTWARSVSGMGKRSGGTEFSSQEALSKYMRQHPKADSSKHSVSNPKQSTQAMQESSKQAPSRLGIAKEIAHVKASDKEMADIKRFSPPNVKQQLAMAESSRKLANSFNNRAKKAETSGNLKAAEELRGRAREHAESYEGHTRYASELGSATPSAPYVPRRSLSDRALEQFAERRAQQGIPPASMARRG